MLSVGGGESNLKLIKNFLRSASIQPHINSLAMSVAIFFMEKLSIYNFTLQSTQSLRTLSKSSNFLIYIGCKIYLSERYN